MREPRHFSSLPLFYRALQMVSTNHFVSPVRKFILDLFDLRLDPETLVGMRSIELSMIRQPRASMSEYRSGSTSKSPIPPDHQTQLESQDGRSARISKQARHGGQWRGDQRVDPGQGRERKRSASSPGPPPIEIIVRHRGMTVSGTREGLLDLEERENLGSTQLHDFGVDQ